MNLKINFFFALLLFTFYTNAQVELKGKVLDTLQSPLESASVVAINKVTNALDAYTMTDDLGLFSLNLKQNTKYKIQVSYFGLQTINDSLSTQTTSMKRDYTLRADIELDEVVVKIPVLIRGDTLIYDADLSLIHI